MCEVDISTILVLKTAFTDNNNFDIWGLYPQNDNAIFETFADGTSFYLSLNSTKYGFDKYVFMAWDKKRIKH